MRAIKKDRERRIKGGFLGMMTLKAMWHSEKSLDLSLGVCLGPNSNSALGLVI